MNEATEQESVIAFLSQGAAYGRPHDKVARIDTHASVVFLVRDHAFKLKRAIRFSFLDYSTVAKREAMCRAEFDLNRRTAPQLYRAVRAVTRSGNGTLALDGDGDAIDWLVEMNQFPQDDLFDRMAETHRLNPTLMRDLADRVAAFHEDAARCGDGGFEAAMRAIAVENLANLRRAGDALDQDKVAALARLVEPALDRLAPLLRQRKTRRCHGDLHLRNICLIDGQPVLFDGIEFNDLFSCIDPLYDVAFLLMDLCHRDLGALANLVFNRYLDRGPQGGLALLPLYLAVRAGVRTLVSVTAMTRQSDAGEKQTLARDTARYLDAALGFLQPARPRLVAVGGLSGSGKSTVARSLAPDFAPAPGARLLRSDVTRKTLADVAPETRLPKSAYDKASSDRVYRRLYDEAETVLAAGYTAIVDAAFLDAGERDAIAAVAARADVAFTGLWTQAPEATLRQRIAARTDDASDADLDVLEFQLGRDVGTIAWHRLDADAPRDAVVKEARRLVGDTLSATRRGY